jgi:hypothetical protein
MVITRVHGHGTPCVYTTRQVCHTYTCTTREHPSTCTWSPLVYMVITRVRGHGTSCVDTTRWVCHTSTCTSRRYLSICTWTSLVYVVTAHHAWTPLVEYAIRVHVRHVDTRVCIHHSHMEYAWHMEMCRCRSARTTRYTTHARIDMYVDAFVASGWEDAEAVGVRVGIPRMGERNVIDGMSYRTETNRLWKINVHTCYTSHRQELQPRAQGVCMSLQGATKEYVRWRELQPRAQGVCTSLHDAT